MAAVFVAAPSACVRRPSRFSRLPRCSRTFSSFPAPPYSRTRLRYLRRMSKISTNYHQISVAPLVPHQSKSQVWKPYTITFHRMEGGEVWQGWRVTQLSNKQLPEARIWGTSDLTPLSGPPTCPPGFGFLYVCSSVCSTLRRVLRLIVILEAKPRLPRCNDTWMPMHWRVSTGAFYVWLWSSALCLLRVCVRRMLHLSDLRGTLFAFFNRHPNRSSVMSMLQSLSSTERSLVI